MGDIRIISGVHGSRRIKAPDSIARPTTDRVRESLFSSLVSMRGGLEDARILDAYAGSGALALEAMSRGAQFACLIERDMKALKVVCENVATLGYDQSEVQVISADSLDVASLEARLAPSSPFDLIFLDAPYAYASYDVLQPIAHLRSKGIIAADALISYEHDSGTDPSETLTGSGIPFDIVKSKKFGKTTISILRSSS